MWSHYNNYNQPTFMIYVRYKSISELLTSEVLVDLAHHGG